MAKYYKECMNKIISYSYQLDKSVKNGANSKLSLNIKSRICVSKQLQIATCQLFDIFLYMLCLSYVRQFNKNL